MKYFALILALCAQPALATQEYILPTLFDVSGVDTGDVLNIRAEPSASAGIIGSFDPDVTHIEVVEETRGWGRVNTGEQSGWVNMRYLTYRTDVWDSGVLPAGFSCFGTEPFWSVAPKNGALVMSTPEAADAPRQVDAVLDSGIFRDPARAVTAGDLTLIATPQSCSDGMSDRLFGLRAMLVQHGDTPRLWTGCCSVQPR